jgi:hypothetical protein
MAEKASWSMEDIGYELVMTSAYLSIRFLFIGKNFQACVSCSKAYEETKENKRFPNSKSDYGFNEIKSGNTAIETVPS